MPELPEVETVRKGLAPAFEGARIVHVEQRRADLRFAFPENFVPRLEGQTVERLTRRAKYLLAWLSGGEVLIMHLGMSGRFTVINDRDKSRFSAVLRAANASDAALSSALPPSNTQLSSGGNPAHDHVVFHLNSGAAIIYNDARRFGYMGLTCGALLDQHKYFHKLGIEPLSHRLTAQFLSGAAAHKNVTLKAFLMDQRIIAGLGNIYVCEALFRAKLSPKRAASCLSTAAKRPSARAVRLVEAITSVLEEAIRAGGSTLRDYQHTDGSLGYFQHAFKVYDRAEKNCRSSGCHGRISRIVQNGRSTFYCPACQR